MEAKPSPEKLEFGSGLWVSMMLKMEEFQALSKKEALWQEKIPNHARINAVRMIRPAQFPAERKDPRPLFPKKDAGKG